MAKVTCPGIAQGWDHRSKNRRREELLPELNIGRWRPGRAKPGGWRGCVRLRCRDKWMKARAGADCWLGAVRRCAAVGPTSPERCRRRGLLRAGLRVAVALAKQPRAVRRVGPPASRRRARVYLRVCGIWRRVRPAMRG